MKAATDVNMAVELNADWPVEFADLGERFDAALLDQAYREIYLPAFPVRDEQEDPSIWTPRLRAADANPRLAYLVAGTQLADPAQRVLLGLLVAEFYAASGCVLISYVAVSEAARGRGLARALFAALRQRIAGGTFSRGQAVRAVFAEIHDPAAIAAGDDVLDPQARLHVMARLGGRRVPVDYLQPPLGPGQSAAGGLWLIAFPDLAPAASPLSAETVRAFLLEFYRELGSAQPESDPLYAATFASIDALAGRPRLLEPLIDEHAAAV